MSVNVKSSLGLRCFYSRKALLAVFLLFMVILFSSCFVSVFNSVSPFVSGAPDKVVRNEAELRDAINNSVNPVIIALGNDIALTGSLVIPVNKDVTLISDSTSELFKLIGANSQNTITVDGVLKLEDVIVTHPRGAGGIGVFVSSGGTLRLSGGEISGNLNGPGGGVYSRGVFTMVGGKVSNNSGGGVFNEAGSFSMSGGEISGNTAMSGGGVDNQGSFSMSGGVICNNDAWSGAGVRNSGTFKMSGGKISNNIGGGVYNGGSFSLSGGEISGNTAMSGAGVTNSGYTALFEMSNGVISDNVATGNGGGVYNEYGRFNLSGGKISNNSAVGNGGGIGVFDFADLELVFISGNVVFSNNRAATAHNRDPIHDSLYNSHISNTVTWTSPFIQGYNNYDISYTHGVSLYYTVTVSNSYATSTGAGSYSAEERVTVNAGVREGYDFFGWSIIEGGITLTNSPSATFTMPSNNVAVSANWVPTSSGGDSNGSTPSNSPTTSEPSNPPISPEPSNLPTNSPSNPQLSGNGGISIMDGFGVQEVIVICIIVPILIAVVATLLIRSSKKKGTNK
jgi:hypothetical protein